MPVIHVIDGEACQRTRSILVSRWSVSEVESQDLMFLVQRAFLVCFFLLVRELVGNDGVLWGGRDINLSRVNLSSRHAGLCGVALMPAVSSWSTPGQRSSGRSRRTY